MKTNIAILVTTSPLSSFTYTAYRYCIEALSLGAQIVGVFFYQDGVENAHASLGVASDELNMHSYWKELNRNYGIPLHLCITAGEKRGITENELGDESSFLISGLGELVTLSCNADRLVQF